MVELRKDKVKGNTYIHIQNAMDGKRKVGFAVIIINGLCDKRFSLHGKKPYSLNTFKSADSFLGIRNSIFLNYTKNCLSCNASSNLEF